MSAVSLGVYYPTCVPDKELSGRQRAEKGAVCAPLSDSEVFRRPLNDIHYTVGDTGARLIS